MGRTGRKRKGRIIVLVGEGKEEAVCGNTKILLTFDNTWIGISCWSILVKKIDRVVAHSP